MDITKISSKWNNEIDIIYNAHVLEHFPYKSSTFSPVTVIEVLNDWFKALKPNGILRLSVPNFQSVVEHYLIYKDLEVLRAFLVGGQKYDCE